MNRPPPPKARVAISYPGISTPHSQLPARGCPAGVQAARKTAWLSLWLACAASLSSHAASLPFTSVDAGPLTLLTDQTYTATWGDYDGDGRPDVYLPTLFNAPAALFRNTPSGFERITTEPAGAGTASRAGAVWVDINNDGRLDLFVGTTAAEDDTLYLAKPGGGFEQATGAPWQGSAGYGQSAMTFDFNRDGLADLFVPNGGGWQAEPNLLLRNTGNGTFTRVTEGIVPTESRYSVASAAGDYDGDGWPDLFVANIYGPNSLFRNLGDGTFEQIFTGPGDPNLVSPQGASSGVWVDFDNDGDLDLFTPNGEGNPLYRNDQGVLTRVEIPPLTTSRGFCIGAVFADFDNDGWLDALIARRQAGQLLFRNTGNGGFETVETGPIAQRPNGANGVAVADYDLDGDVDVLLTNWEGNGSPSLYRNDTTGNHWLRVKLEGTRSSFDGVGAVVRVKATLHGRTFSQMRQIGGDDAQGSQELIAHFGLADAARVESLRVEWPSGLVQTLLDVPSDQRLVLREQPVNASELPHLDPQTGLYEQRVQIDYGQVRPTNAFRIYITDLPERTTLINATATDALGSFVQAPQRSQVPGGIAVFTLKYYRSTRGKFDRMPRFTLHFQNAPTIDIPVGDRFGINRTGPLADGGNWIEFNAEPGARYRIEYSDDNNAWSLVPSEIVAGGSKVLWMDRGLPDTERHPASVMSRFYRVVRIAPATP